jgi:hypothetical protein
MTISLREMQTLFFFLSRRLFPTVLNSYALSELKSSYHIYRFQCDVKQNEFIFLDVGLFQVVYIARVGTGSVHSTPHILENGDCGFCSPGDALPAWGRG